jgi:hypothetical protein
VYDLQTLKRRKVLQSPEVGSQEYVSLGFSPDGKQLIAQVMSGAAGLIGVACWSRGERRALFWQGGSCAGFAGCGRLL